MGNAKIANHKRIAITLGDPGGIGPEIVYKSLRNHPLLYPVIIIGSREKYEDKSVPLIGNIDEIGEKGIYFYHIAGDKPAGHMSDVSYSYVKTGIQWALQKKIAALVTAPISKEKWLKAGLNYKGHTQLLADTAGVKKNVMFFWSDNLKVALFSVHIPLKKIFQRVKKNEIVDFTRFTARELSRLFSKEFSFLVSGLNPHAGEEGFLGKEEIDEIMPAIAELKAEMDISGPFPPDTVFLNAKDKKDTVVIAWYHDQGLIPFKLLNIHNGVNLTLGLPYIRTAPDHGTAFDITGKGIADPSSMKEALRLAEYLVH
ncbi:MAG: 4-hydroxythreonine-4-phosphate dehydrogenase PdxA [bacterium]|nr:4-hydroxythreonine-4-phosphate dehydrogenase PdxA [bacterium]